MSFSAEFNHIFSDRIPDQEPSTETGAAMIALWTSRLLTAINVLGRQSTSTGELVYKPDVLDLARQAVTKWASESAAKVDHGAWHSYYVYEGERWMAQQEERATEVADTFLQAQAVLHDIMQFLPFNSPTTGESLPGDQRRRHAIASAALVQTFGSIFGLSSVEVHELSQAIRVHDDVFADKMHHISYAGQLLSDADKLFGAALPAEEPEIIVSKTIERNYTGAHLADGSGWYIFRDDSSEGRAQWQYGDRWNRDGVSAVKKGMFDIQFYTEVGQKLAQERRDIFARDLEKNYTPMFDEAEVFIKDWKELVEQQGVKNIPVKLVGKNQPAGLPLNYYSIAEAVRTAYNRELDTLAPESRRPGCTPKGWMIKLGERILDPSIGRFVMMENGRNVFFEELRKVFALENQVV